MHRFRTSNFRNIESRFCEKTGVNTTHHTKKRHRVHTLCTLLVILLCSLSLSAFGFARFSSLAGDDLSLYSVYRGAGVVEIHVENRSSVDLKFQPQLKLMRWVGAEEGIRMFPDFFHLLPRCVDGGVRIFSHDDRQ